DQHRHQRLHEIPEARFSKTILAHRVKEDAPVEGNERRTHAEQQQAAWRTQHAEGAGKSPPREQQRRAERSGPERPVCEKIDRGHHLCRHPVERRQPPPEIG
ncbi:MAG: hypothetical protein ACK559_35785, partial [bacterium]